MHQSVTYTSSNFERQRQEVRQWQVSCYVIVIPQIPSVSSVYCTDDQVHIRYRLSIALTTKFTSDTANAQNGSQSAARETRGAHSSVAEDTCLDTVMLGLEFPTFRSTVVVRLLYSE